MALTFIPTIQQGLVVNVSLSFDKPLSIADFKKLVRRLETNSKRRKKVASNTRALYEPWCMKQPIYSNGEIIAILEKYPDGTSKRDKV